VSAKPGLVGRYVSVPMKQGEKTFNEVCEVVACQVGGDYGSYRILVATSNGKLHQVGYDSITLVADPTSEGSPYR
jgi:hypothetical protein